jgi:uncharacterized membrane protein YkoI
MKRILMAALSAVVLWGLPAVAPSAQDGEKKVKMSQLPAAVQATVKEQSKGAQLRGLSQETEHGQTFYEAELRVNGHTKDVLIDPSGKVVSVEEQVSLNALPAAVKAEIVKQAGKGRIALVESVTKDGALAYYEAQIKGGGKPREVKVGPDGKFIK